MKLTREQILEMEPGRELDRLVALYVMGLDESNFNYDTETGTSERIRQNETFGEVWEPFNPSTDIAAAWEVVDKLKLCITPQSTGAPKELAYMVECEIEINVDGIRVFAETAPEAICKAALLAAQEGE